MSTPLNKTTFSTKQRQEVALFIDAESRKGNKPNNREIVEYIQRQYGGIHSVDDGDDSAELLVIRPQGP